MRALDVILNLAGLLLWLQWRAAAKSGARSAKRAAMYLGGLLALIVGRAVFYWQVGPPMDWIAKMPLGPTTLSFSSNFPARIALYSALSFGATLGLFYLFVLLLSLLAARASDGEAGRRLAREHLGSISRWPDWVKLLLPLAVMAAMWCALHPALVRLGLAPAAPSFWRLAAQGAIIGLSVYLTLKFAIIALLGLHVVNSYVYLGEFSFWNFINAAAREALRPLRRLPLRAGKIDLAPAFAIVAVALAAAWGERGLTHLYLRLI